MFKKVFGPKKTEGIGEPVSTSEIKNVILTYLPKEGEINQYLSFEDMEKSEGLKAVWEFYDRDRDEEGIRHNYLMKHTLIIDIRPDEKAVYLKHRHFQRTKRIPKDEPIYDPWFQQIQIGKLEDLQKIDFASLRSYSTKKVVAPLVEGITQHGWDAYSPKL